MKISLALLSSILMTMLNSNVVFSEEIEVSGGEWTGVGYGIEGGWKIVNRDNQNFIIFDNSFNTRSGPDLKIYLSTKSIGDLKDKNVEKSSIKISPLQSNSGHQEYKIPDNLELGDFRSLLIHCEAYSHLWGGSNIRTGAE